MRTISIFCLSLFLLVVCGSCSVLQTVLAPDEPTRQAYQFTDEQAQAFARRLESLSTDDGTIQRGASAEALLREIGLDPTGLLVVERHIGDCIDITVYDLSASYELLVDNNACSGLRLAITSKQ